ncbi:MAG: hypothetical protein EOS72_21710 [Mesorhizobium sp.]|nr:MAG: hypothetical protein EOS72_21710 [Mesorhizobium sp.]
MLPGFIPRTVPLRRSMKELIKDAGLSSVVQMCFDPGDKDSYPGNGQTVFDVSGNGYQLMFGASTAVATDDPGWAGTVDGQSASEMFTFDGGDFFQLTANDSFVQSLHKVGATFTALIIAAGFSSGVSIALLNSKAGAVGANQVGSIIYKGSGNFLGAIVGGASAAAQEVGTVQTVPTTGMQMLAVGRQLITSTNRVTDFYINGVWETKTDTASVALSTGNATATLAYGTAGDGSAKVPASHSLFGLTVFNRRLVQAELDLLRSSFKRRWPSI